MTHQPRFTAKIKASEARREIQMRKRVYARNGDIRADDAQRIRIMEEIATEYEIADAAAQERSAPKLI